MSYRIFANHAHLFPKEAKPSGTLDNLKRTMDEVGIEKAVCFAPFASQLRNAGLSDDDAPKWIADEIKNEPNLVGFGTIDFDKNSIEAQVREIYDLGLKGIKIHPAYQEVKVDGPQACRVYETAEELGLFISFHTGLHWHRIADYHQLLFDEVAFMFPHLRFSMEHMGGYSFFNEALLVMNNNKRGDFDRVFAGWTSISVDADESGSPQFGAWSLSDRQLLDLIYQTGPDRSIFGLDFPYNDPAYLKAAIGRIISLPISEQAKENILGGTLRRLLNVD
ncbi:MAG: amidohydrolase family protein [Clostridiales bacterium]|nr:amidohydrolase family protein [Clostridiales bacterium]